MFSVIVAAYNVEKYIDQCIGSILEQEYKDFELIVVDDGSTDNTASKCDSWSRKDKRVKTVHKRNGGLVSARKAGLASATNNYVCFVDGDDFIPRGVLLRYSEVLLKYDVDIVDSAHYVCSLEDSTWSVPYDGRFTRRQIRENIWPILIFKNSYFDFNILPSVCFKCFKRSILIGLYRDLDEGVCFGEDASITYPAYLIANSVYFNNRPSYCYRVNTSSITHTYRKDMCDEVICLLRHLKSRMKPATTEIEKQVDLYALFVLKCLVNNEMNYGRSNSYRDKKTRLKKAVSDPNFKSAIKGDRGCNIKDKILFFCLRNNCFWLLYILFVVINKIRGAK